MSITAKNNLIFHSLHNGSLRDQVGSAHGTLTQGASRGFIQTPKGLMMEFDGTSTNVALDSSTPFAVGSTLSCIINLGKVGSSSQMFIASDGSYGIRYNTASGFLLFTSTISAVAYTATDKLINFACRRNSSSETEYFVDGVSLGVGGADSNILPIERFGMRSSALKFEGPMSEVRVYNKLLSTSELYQLNLEYQNLKPLSDSPKFNLNTQGTERAVFAMNFDYAPADGINLPAGVKAEGGNLTTGEDASGKYIEASANDVLIIPGVDLGDYTKNGFITEIGGDLVVDKNTFVDDSSRVSVADNSLKISILSGEKLRPPVQIFNVQPSYR